MDGARFYLQDQTGKVLINSYSAEYDLPEGEPRVVDGSHPGASLALASGTAASDQELLQYIETAGVHQLAGTVEHWLASKGPLDDPKHEQGRQVLLEIARAIPMAVSGGANVRGNVPAALIEKIMASPPLADPVKEQQRQKFLQQIRETGKVPIPPESVSVSSSGFPGFGFPGFGSPVSRSSAAGRYRLRESLILPGQEYHVTGTCVENPEAHDAHDRNMIVQGHNEEIFLISCKPERELQQGLRKRAVGMVFGGAALALICLALLSGHLGLY
jgi:hypothetical protein